MIVNQLNLDHSYSNFSARCTATGGTNLNLILPNIIGIISYNIFLGVSMPISGKELAKLFIKAGYEIVTGGKGSHMKLKKAGFPTVIIPNHRELKTGLEHALRKTLQLVERD